MDFYTDPAEIGASKCPERSADLRVHHSTRYEQ